MCGILGFRGVAFAERPSDALLLLAHRGPDDQGEWSERAAGVWLGSRRLAVLDVSDAGHQPMLAAGTGDAIAMNGEIFNFAELRQELVLQGHRFKSAGDTEVVLALFQEFGPTFVSRLRGMFAIAIWEARSRRLWLYRDRLGIKPLYCYVGREGFAFGSECRALRALLPSRSWPLSRGAIDSYLTFGSVSEPSTLWADLTAVPPGTSMCWDGARLTSRTYWSLDTTEDATVTETDAITETRRLLEDAVESHGQSDVPLGSFLSGGIDSTALVGLLSARAARVQTLTVDIPGLENADAAHAALVARHFGTNHSEIALSSDQCVDWVSSSVSSQDQPSIDGTNTWIVSRAARQAGLTVSFSGVGADELFFGYEHFRRIGFLRSRLARFAVPAIARSVPIGSPNRRHRLRAIASAGNDRSAFSRIRALWSPAELATMGVATPPPAGDEAGSLENRLSRYELDHYLRNTLLRDTDVMSMAHGLEVRVPFLDHHVVEFISRLPPAIKWGSGAVKKHLLVKACEDLLPAAVVGRRKQGFELPFDAWLRHELEPETGRALAHLTSAEILPRGFVEARWREFRQGRLHWSRVWQLAVLGQHLARAGQAGHVEGTPSVVTSAAG